MLSVLSLRRYQNAAAVGGLSFVSNELNEKHKDFSNSFAAGLKLSESAVFF